MKDKMTDIWSKYEKSKDYIQKKNLVSKTNENWQFYKGNQWVGSPNSNKFPVMNFIKPTIRYKIAVICQNSMTALYSDMENGNNGEIFGQLNLNFTESWEKGKMYARLWDIVEASAVQGDSYAYWGGNDTRKPPQILDNTAVLFGDENTKDIQKQPYIIIVERKNLEEVKKQAKENKAKDADLIAADNSTQDSIGNTDEVTDKVTTLLYMEKKDGVVHIARSTKQCVYEPLTKLQPTQNGQEVGIGLRSYPICNFLWDSEPNSARGLSEVAEMIPNQIELNKTLARRGITVKQTAFPRLAYDTTAIENPDDLDKVGVAIGVNGGGVQSINQMVGYLNATSMSSDAEAYARDLLNTTRELAGAGDYATGNVNPEQASGTAIIAVRDQAQLPLNKQAAELQRFVEECALVFFDIWATYNPIEGIELIEPSVRIDISKDNSWSKMGEQQWLDQVYQKGDMTLEEYVEASPEGGVIPKARMKELLEKRQQMQQQPVEESEYDEIPEGVEVEEGILEG